MIACVGTMEIYKSQGKQSRRSKDIRDQDSATPPISRIYYEMGIEAISAKLIYKWFCYSFAYQFLSAKKSTTINFFKLFFDQLLVKMEKHANYIFWKHEYLKIIGQFTEVLKTGIIILLLMTD